MEKRDPINDEVELLNCTSLLDQVCPFSKLVDILPKQEIHSTERVEKTECFLNSQELGAILVELPLIEEIVAHLELFSVRINL